MTFGFGNNNKNPHETIYHDYIGKPVRVDVAGNIGGTGIIKECTPHNRGHLIYLSPYIFYTNNNPRIISKEELMINTNGNPVSIYPLEKDLEQFLEEEIKDTNNKNNKESKQS